MSEPAMPKPELGLTTAEVEQLKRAVAAAMVAEARKIPQQPTREEIIQLGLSIPHIEEVAQELRDYLKDEDLIWPFTGLGRFYYLGQGFYQQAEPWLLGCREVAERRLGSDHPDVAASLNNLANLYRSQGRYSEAEPLYLQAVEISDRALGTNHPHTIIFRKNLEFLRSQQS